MTLPSAAAEQQSFTIVQGGEVLIIDDDDDAAFAAMAALDQAGFSAARYDGALTAPGIAAALLASTNPVFLDFHLGGGVTGADALSLLGEDDRASVVIITSDSSPAVLVQAQNLGVQRLLKPLDPDRISDVLSAS